MEDDRLLSEEDFESRMVREAVELLNFMWLLTSAYRAPELVAFFLALRDRLGQDPHPFRDSNEHLN